MEREQAHADISRSALYAFAVYIAVYMAISLHVVIATKPVHRLQISPIVDQYHSPKLHRARTVVWECGEGQTEIDTHTQTHRRP